MPNPWDDDDDDRPRSSRSRRGPQRQSVLPAWAWLFIGSFGCSLVVMIVIGIIVVYAISPDDPPPKPVDTRVQPQPSKSTPLVEPKNTDVNTDNTTLPQPSAQIAVDREPYILGSIPDPQFESVGPPGAFLVGVEARFEAFGSHLIVRAVQPIYRVRDREVRGEQFGNDLSRSVTLKAKPGYAIGGISGKAELWCHGFSLTYMRVKPDGTLDTTDRYESEWVGWDGPMPVTQVMGKGAPAVGIVGKIVGPKTTALGLLFKGQNGT